MLRYLRRVLLSVIVFAFFTPCSVFGQCIDSSHILDLIEDLKSSDKEISKNAVSDLEDMGIIVVEPLIKALDTEDREFL